MTAPSFRKVSDESVASLSTAGHITRRTAQVAARRASEHLAISVPKVLGRVGKALGTQAGSPHPILFYSFDL